MSNKLDEKILKEVSRRSFFLQALWNYEKLQNIGWAWAVLPALKRLYPDPEKRCRALKTHLEYFNTNPYLGGILLGCTLRQEEEALKDGEDPAACVSAIKQGLMGPLAALGDVLFWATLRPMAALLGVGVFLMGGSNATSAFAGVAVLLTVFNGPHLVARLAGPMMGWKKGREIIQLLRKLDVPYLVTRAHLSGLVLLATVGACMGLYVYPGSDQVMPMRDNLLYFGSGALMLTALRFKVRAPWILVALALVALLAGHLESLPQLVKP